MKARERERESKALALPVDWDLRSDHRTERLTDSQVTARME